MSHMEAWILQDGTGGGELRHLVASGHSTACMRCMKGTLQYRAAGWAVQSTSVPEAGAEATSSLTAGIPPVAAVQHSTGHTCACLRDDLGVYAWGSVIGGLSSWGVSPE